MFIRRVYLYAFAHGTLRVINTKFLQGEEITMTNLLRLGRWMKETSPESVVVYAVDNRRGLYDDFMEALRSKDFTAQVDFADMISREGIQIA